MSDIIEPTDDVTDDVEGHGRIRVTGDEADAGNDVVGHGRKSPAEDDGDDVTGHAIRGRV